MATPMKRTTLTTAVAASADEKSTKPGPPTPTATAKDDAETTAMPTHVIKRAGGNDKA